MKVSKIILTALTLMTIASSAMAAATPQNEDYCHHKMKVWTKMCEQGDLVQPTREAYHFYLEGDMRVAYYDEWVNVDEKDFKAKNITTVGLPMKAHDLYFKGNN